MFCVIAFQYDEGAIAQLEDVLYKCRSIMLPGASLFVALQTNTLQDMGGGYAKNWSQMVQDFQLRLEQENKFFCPKLEINFRNTSSIFETANTMEMTEGMTNNNVHNTLGIPTIGTTLEASQVRKINFNWNPRNKKQVDLDQGLSHVFERLDKEIEVLDDPIVIMFDDTSFTMDQIYDGVKSSLKSVNIYRYPSISDSDPEKEIDQFFSHTKGVLITSHGLFKGAEAENIISLQRSNVTSSNIRGTLLRAVSRLYILMGVAEHEYYQSKNTINDDSLLHCFEQSYENVWECLTCSHTLGNKVYVCTPCKKIHHVDHIAGGRSIQMRKLDKRCQCTCSSK